MHVVPWTDLNDLNLDWLLSNMKKIVSEWAAYQVSMNNKFDSLAAAYKALHDWIDYYFRNLNVQDQINNKLDAMAASGELREIIKPTVISTTESWLERNIDNQSYPLDASLSLANAAAPAKTVGDKAWMWRGTMITPTNPPTEGALDDLDKATSPGVYIIKYDNLPLHSPEQVTNKYRYLIVAQGSSVGFIQTIYINESDHTIYTRRYQGSAWQAWHNAISGLLDRTLAAADLPAQAKATGERIQALSDTAFQRRDLPEGTTLLADLIGPGWFVIATGNHNITDCPDGATSGSRLCWIYTGANIGYKYQFYLNQDTGYTAVRLKPAAGSYGDWIYPGAANISEILSGRTSFSQRATLNGGEDLDDLTNAGWHIIGNGANILNSPEARKGYRYVLIYAGVSVGFLEMIYINRTSGFVAFRVRTSTGWQPWTIVTRGDYDNTLQDTITPTIGKTPYDIAHRGLTDTYPENSMAAFKAARAAGFPWIETDIQFTSDGVPVLQHDLDIDNYYCNPDGSAIGQTINVNTITLAQLQYYDRKKIVSGETVHFEGMKVTTLQQAMETFKKIGLSAMLHFKESVTAALIPSILSVIQASGMFDNVCLMSGSKTILKATADQVSRRKIVFVGQANNCDENLIAYLKTLKVNGNMVGYTSGPWAYSSQTMIDIIDQVNTEGYFITTRIDNATQAETNCRPWAWAYITNGQNGFKPSEYFYNRDMAGFIGE